MPDTQRRNNMIRKMSIEDYEAVYALWANTPNMGLRNLDDSKEGIALFLKRNPETCFVAFNGENFSAGTTADGDTFITP